MTALARCGLARASLHPVWLNSAGGLTFSVVVGTTSGPADFYVKWNPRESGESLADEAGRLRWLKGRHPVPEIVAYTSDEDQEVLITRALPGRSAVAPVWKSAPERALRALGKGLRRLHEVPVDDCPFDWGIEHRLRVEGIPRSEIGPAPATDRLVVCHGDPCAPNTLIDDDGLFLAHVDLARLGVADRWADLAVLSMSFEWNYADYDEAVFWQAYGIEPDPERIAFYRGLWNVIV